MREIFGIPVIDRHEYERIRQSIADPHNLPVEYDAWLELTEKLAQTKERAGAFGLRIQIDLDSLIAYSVRFGTRTCAAHVQQYADGVARNFVNKDEMRGIV